MSMSSLFLKLRKRAELTGEEEKALEATVSEVRTLPRNSVIVRAHTRLSNSTMLTEGFVCRYRYLPDGKRQILAIHVPGDFIDLHSFMLKELEHDMAALTRVKLSIVPHGELRRITETMPRLGRLLWLSTLLDAAMHREWIMSLSRSATGRVAHLLCELQVRLEVVGLADHGGYPLPLTQIDIADATGLTSVHVNRVLRQLRDAGIVDLRNRHVTILDLDRLRDEAEFDSSYLYLATDDY